jgi:hypothetical protein
VDVSKCDGHIKVDVSKCDGQIKVDVKEVRLDVVHWIYLAQETDHWQAL